MFVALWKELSQIYHPDNYDSQATSGSKQVRREIQRTIKYLVDDYHNIDCKITGIGAIMLKSKFVKKA